MSFPKYVAIHKTYRHTGITKILSLHLFSQNNFEMPPPCPVTIDECDSGTQLDSNGTCVNCPQGSYRTLGIHQTCRPCPHGFITPSDGAENMGQCTIGNTGISMSEQSRTFLWEGDVLLLVNYRLLAILSVEECTLMHSNMVLLCGNSCFEVALLFSSLVKFMHLPEYISSFLC